MGRGVSTGPQKRLKRGLKGTATDLVVCFIAGIGLWAAFPDISLPLLVIPSFALVLSRVDRVGAWRAFVYMLTCGMTFWLLLIPWTIQATGGSKLPWIALSFVEAFFFAVWASRESGLMRL